ncbi:MAG: inositol monophosphatase [Elusimicrobiota bacterium]|jgi:myo-inositol-1(or 4)-monophosphatase|nr:inositol monophosphatase [Elusimicrobiota bacterium]
MLNYSKYLKTAVFAAKEGGKILSYYYQSKLTVEFKGKRDPVSQADRNSQKKIISILKKAYPSHGILAEEDGVKDIKEFCWIIDPLDGTVNFVHSLPIFCVSIGLLYRGEIIAGVIYNPMSKEMFTAYKGGGAYLNGKQIKVGKNTDLMKSIAVTGFPYDLEIRYKRVMKNFIHILNSVQGVRRLGSAALDTAWVACGRFDFYWEEGLKPWDAAAGIIIVQEAGGKISDYKGSARIFETSTILCANPTIHKKVLGILNEKR